MKKVTILFGAALMACSVFSSCKKCVTCTYTPPGDIQVKEDFCSTSSSERDAFRALKQLEAISEGTTATCD